MEKRGVILVIRDGWGFRKDKKDNAILNSNAEFEKELQKYPHTLLKCSGIAVGLPEGYQGNSEVGHMTLGSGRIIFQSLERINESITKGDFFKIPEFLDAIKKCKKNNSDLHLIGLIQVEGVHSHLNHLLALLDLCKKENFKNVKIHAITDGRDSPPTDSLKNIKIVLDKIKELGFGEISTISGRYYTMDRDKRWERTRRAYDCIAKGAAEEFDDVVALVKRCHANKETDEFIVPRKVKGYEGIKDKDSVIFFNFRTDRTRQLTQAIVEKNFEGWDRKPLNVFFVAMTQFYNPMNAKVAFKDQSLKNLLGETISKHKLKQLRISETEKYAHVTFFFNCQNEKPFEGEDRILINSPKVATYDLQPEMSAFEVSKKLVEEINKDKYDFAVVNLVNGDMVGHTGNTEAIKKAIETVDECTKNIVEAGLQHNYTTLVTADHGNAEDKSPEWSTSHTLNPVPIYLVSKEEKLRNTKLSEGKGLQDVAPTILWLLGISKPGEMTGESIILSSSG